MLKEIMEKRKYLLKIAIVPLFVVIIVSCSYSTERPFRKDIKTICVKPFGSREFRRRIEMSLTEAIKKRINLDTPYKLTDEKHADTLLTGEVLKVSQGTMGRDFRLNVPRETQLTLAVRFQWKDLRTGKIIVKKDRWLQTYDYCRPTGETEFTGLQSAIDKMAETIVEQLEQEW